MTSHDERPTNHASRAQNPADKPHHVLALSNSGGCRCGNYPAHLEARADEGGYAQTHRQPAGGRQEEAEEEAGQLLKLLARGDSAAFWHLWRQHEAYLFAICLRKFGGLREDAEDALSLVMLKAWDSLPRHAGSIINFKAWMTRLTLNLCTDIQRRHHRWAKLVDSVEGLAQNNRRVPRSAETPEEIVLTQELRLHLSHFIEDLPHRLREPIFLRFVQEMSYSDISLCMTISVENVRKRIQQARDILRARVWEYLAGGGEPTARKTAPMGAAERAAPLRLVEPDEGARRPAEMNYRAKTIILVGATLPTGTEICLHVLSGQSASRLSRSSESLAEYVRRHPGGWKKRLELAFTLYALGRFDEALAEYQKVLERRPRLMEAHLGLGELLHALGREAEAVGAYERALQAARKPASRHHISGLVELCRRDYVRASDQFRLASRLEPRQAAHWHRLGLTCLRTGSYAEALQAFDECLNINPEDGVALTYSCDALRASGRPAEACRRITRALALDPSNVKSLKRLADYRSRAGLVSGNEGRITLRLIERARRVAREAAAVHESLALFYVSRGEWRRGVETLRDFIGRHPNHSRAWRYYAQLLFRTGETEAALQAVRRGRALDVSDPRALQLVCELTAYAGQHEMSRLFAEEMLLFFPYNSSVWATAGLALAAAGREPELACDISSRGTALHPELPAAWFGHGRVLALAGRHSEAVWALKIGRSLLAEGDSEQGISAAFRLGVSRSQLGEEAEARVCWSEVLKLADDAPHLNPASADYWRARAFERLGDRRRALLAYQSALRRNLLYPERRGAQKSVEALYSTA